MKIEIDDDYAVYAIVAICMTVLVVVALIVSK